MDDQAASRLPAGRESRGLKNALQDYSRVLQFDPTTLKIVCQYTLQEAGLGQLINLRTCLIPACAGLNGNGNIHEILMNRTAGGIES